MKTIRNAAAFGLLLWASAGLAQERTIEGRLESSDPVADDSSYFDEHRISVGAGERLAIRVVSEAFDPVVEIFRAGHSVAIGHNDDDGTSFNARYVLSAPAAGDYIVRVRSFGERSRGAYRIALTPMPPLPAPVTAHQTMETTYWKVFQGEINPNDPEAQGRHFDDYQVSLRQGQVALIRADTEAFDPLIEVMAANERDGPAMATDDDSGPGLGALLIFEAPLDGDYIVRVYALNPESRGPYILRVAN